MTLIQCLLLGFTAIMIFLCYQELVSISKELETCMKFQQEIMHTEKALERIKAIK